MKKLDAAFVSGGSSSMIFVPLIGVFVKTGIAIHSIGIVPRFVEYMGVIVPVGM